MTAPRTARRLSRSGTVHRVSAGCTTIRVSVPCTSCRVGYCRGLSSNEFSVIASDNIGSGDRVDISISAPALNRLAIWLFGPTLAWFALLAALPAMAPVAQLNMAAFASVGVAGVIGTLLLGRRLASARLAILDLRLASQ